MLFSSSAENLLKYLEKFYDLSRTWELLMLIQWQENFILYENFQLQPCPLISSVVRLICAWTHTTSNLSKGKEIIMSRKLQPHTNALVNIYTSSMQPNCKINSILGNKIYSEWTFALTPEVVSAPSLEVFKEEIEQALCMKWYRVSCLRFIWF